MSMDKYIRFSKAARLVPGRRSQATVFRWAKKGVKGVHLRHIRVGGVNYTTEEWIEKFFEDLAAADVAGRRVPAARPAHLQIVDHETADRELGEAGL